MPCCMLSIISWKEGPERLRPMLAGGFSYFPSDDLICVFESLPAAHFRSNIHKHLGSLFASSIEKDCVFLRECTWSLNYALLRSDVNIGNVVTGGGVAILHVSHVIFESQAPTK